jgi:hypothetical protein
MRTALRQIVRFVNVAPGVTSLPHGLNVDGTAQIPDRVWPAVYGGANVTVTADATNVTLTNLGVGNASADVFVELDHTIDRAYPQAPVGDGLLPRPFVLSGGGSGATVSAYVAYAATAANLAAAAGPAPTAPQATYVGEFDAIYIWHPADVTAVDNFRVIGHTGGVAGTWILDGNVITLSPLGGGANDWVRVENACAAMAYFGEVWLAAGAWVCNAVLANGIANGTVLRGNPGVNVAVTLPQSAPVDFSNCPFFNDGDRDLALTTITVGGNPQDTTVTVASTVGIAIGSRILIEQLNAYWKQRSVKNIVGNVLTLDRPLTRPFTNGSVVSVTTTTRDIKIYGGGMTVTGTGVEPVEFVTARDCYLSDIHFKATGAGWQFGPGFDVGSRDCVMERITMDCANLSNTAFLVAFGGENIDLDDCDGYNAGPAGAAACVYLESCDDIHVDGGFFSGSSGTGAILTRVNVADTIGCRGITLSNATFDKATAAGISVDIGDGNNFVACNTSFNQSGVTYSTNATNNATLGGAARGNTVAAGVNSGTGNKWVGCTVENFDSTAYQAQGGTCEIADCTITDTSTAAVVDAHITSFGATTICRVSGVRSTVTARNLQHFARVYSGSSMFFDGNCRFDATAGTTNNWGVLCDQGVARVSGTVINSTGAGSNGLNSNGANGYLRVSDDVNVSTCPTPFGGTLTNFNRGTVALTANVAKAVAFGDTKTTDRLWWTYTTTLAGATGLVTGGGTPVAATGFNLTAAVGDTSTVAYWIN